MMLKSVIVGSFALFGAVSVRAEAYEVGEAMKHEAFWKSDTVLFVKNHQNNGFKFTSEDRTSADSRREGGVTYFGIPVYETRVSFSGESGIDRVEIMLFNRGGTERVEEIQLDDGKKLRRVARNEKTMTRDEFFKALADVRAKLTKPGAKPPAPVDDRTQDASIRQRTQTWPKTALPSVASLCWNYSQKGKDVATFKPGYIRLSVDGPAKCAGARGASVAASEKVTAKSAKKIVENVIRDPRGDVFIDNVPMVDQGMKGYCAVAAAERVMRYYGLDVDEHEIAEAAGTKAEEGTSTLAMKESVDRIGKKYRLANALLYGDFSDGVEARIANLGKEVDNYNKAAKKLKKSAITDDVYIRREGNMTHYDPSAVDRAMDPEVLKEMKTNGAQKAKFTKFMKDVRQYVDAGMPLFWGVILGRYPEDDLPQTMGGHMRLIIGYNDKKGEILYSDTWGKGHELKRMPAGWAWTITRSLMAMKPLK